MPECLPGDKPVAEPIMRAGLRRRCLHLVDGEGTPYSGYAYWASRRAGPPTVFASKPPEILLCPQCGDVFSDPVLFPCGHAFCRSCAAPSGSQAVCLNGCGVFAPEDCHPDYARRAAVDELTILCGHCARFKPDGETLAFTADGCRVELALGERHRHEAECELAVVQCGLVDDTLSHSPVPCPVRVRKSALGLHQRACPFRRERCRRCRKSIVARARVLHERECAVRDCPNLCGAAVRSEDMHTHLTRDCPEALVQCGRPDLLGDPAADDSPEMRCQFTCRRSDLPAHAPNCEYVATPCLHCSADVSRRRGVRHEADCQAAPVPCPNGCGAILARERIAPHVQGECKERCVPCELHEFGCLIRPQADVAAEHAREAAGAHVTLLARAVHNLVSGQAQLAEDVAALRQEVGALRSITSDKERLLRTDLEAANARAEAEAAALYAELDATRAALEESQTQAKADAFNRTWLEADAAARMYTECLTVRRLLDEALHERFNTLRQLQLELTSWRLEYEPAVARDAADGWPACWRRYQDDVDLLRDRTEALMERHERASTDLKLKVEGDMSMVRATVADDSWQHANKIVRLSSEVEELRRALHTALKVLGPSENGFERSAATRALDLGYPAAYGGAVGGRGGSTASPHSTSSARSNPPARRPGSSLLQSSSEGYPKPPSSDGGGRG